MSDTPRFGAGHNSGLDLERLQRSIRAEKGRRSLKEFVKLVWPWIEPREFSDNWHIDMVAEHLEAVTNGDIKRLLVNLPPRTMKSKLASVIWPVWSWLQADRIGDDGIKIPTCGPGTKYLCFSYDGRLGLDLSLDCRSVIDNEHFIKHYGHIIQLKSDQNAKRRFDNTRGGYRITTSVRGAATGFGGDILNVDDPNRVLTKAVAAELDNTQHWFSEVLPTRLNDRRRGAIVVTMQRTSEKDVSGLILSRQLGYEHLCLPMRFESNHPYVSGCDLREEEDELLWPDRMGEPEVKDLEKTLGSYASSGQLQQRPAPREGGMFKRHWFPIVDAGPSVVADRVRSWDLAATAKTLLSSDPDWTCGVRMSVGLDGMFYIEDAYRFRETPAGVDQNLLIIAQHDRRSTRIRLPQDPGASGKAQASYHGKLLAGYVFSIKPVTGAKETWAQPFAAQCEAGNVVLVRGDWNDEFIDELCNFPTGHHDDQVDAASHAFDALINRDSERKKPRTARSYNGAW